MRHLQSQYGPAEKLIILDVGANEGQTALEIRKHLPLTEIYCFEPDSASYAVLAKTSSASQRIHAFQLALGDVQGTATLYQNKESVTNSLLPMSSEVSDSDLKSVMQNIGKIEVRVETLDHWATSQKLEHIHVLKTDCQGFDLKVLQGASLLLKEKRIDWVCCEVLLASLYSGQAFFDEILSFMRSSGYALQGIYETASDQSGHLAWADALFTRR